MSTAMAPATAGTLTIITGASRGLGEAMALALLRQPHHSVLHLARSHSETLAQTAAEHHNRQEADHRCHARHNGHKQRTVYIKRHGRPPFSA